MIVTLSINWTVILNGLQRYMVPFLAPFFFLYFVRIAKMLNIRKLKYFKASAWMALLLTISDLGEYIFSLYPTFYYARMACACFSYTFRVCLLYLMLQLFIDKKNKTLSSLFKIPMILNLFLSFSAFFTKLAFYYDANYEIVRGPIILSPFIASGIYFIIFIILAFKKLKKGNKTELYLILFVLILTTTGTILEAKFSLKGILATLAFLAVVFYYIYFITVAYTIDGLTGALVRSKLYSDIEKRKSYALILIDINGLKKLNDRDGHAAGDLCIVKTVESIRAVIPQTDKVYRMGGDEFVVILRNTNIDDIIDISRRIKSHVEVEGYSIALGYSIKESDEPFDLLFTQADEMLYQDKHFYKEMMKEITISQQ